MARKYVLVELNTNGPVDNIALTMTVKFLLDGSHDTYDRCISTKVLSDEEARLVS